ncbi:acyl-CoA dehydrogenase [Parageobacillus thermoglucosidasius]|jgi:alkylation response protein AidB-like acyl-CoA dehydrogenase|uniref:acyl-CoA dehydrogenase n=1 Tax=Parageobacillus thermoglucosidasius TaxID=1426 RepID=UPI00025B67FC|nr:acyl-CoA dehydrogenase [Parageobacillus thermoglucosidasius]KYD11972.1 Butyryl-CoA dehydrogenase [Anoxybacillus flavithermus]REK57065.1 MAG: acyl-CoA dehydrogenase [Geobacillus sp.]EID42715.1 acyl-CoA dehydrogenase, short-chain specific [Parageobacillus thermoglucosidasius TNO-09.020]OAO87994.1 Butyryl-CoA dehydrogenase [Parageobacillus thermoglucosidasius]BDG33897.1 acyl-CoA dehydrogenase [Parageobacillus thermoglucosidasius]
MNLQFTEEQEMMRKMVQEFAQTEIAPFVEHMEQGEFPRPILNKMAELGLMGITVPEEYGGAGMDFISYIIAIHEISKVSATVGVILSVHTSVGTNPILYFGTEEQKKKYVPKLASGEYLGAFCLTEPGAGSDAKSLKTKAVRQGDYYILNGSKIFITNGGEADTYIVFARTDPNEKGSRGISAFIVEKGTPGFIIGKDEKKMGLHGSRTVQIMFEDAKVPAENLLGEEGQGFKIAMANLDSGRIGIAAQSLGIAEAALEHATAYAKERIQFGKPIAEQQGVAFKLADMATAVEAAKLLVYHAAFLRAQGLRCGKEAAMAKLFASRTAMENAIEAVQIFGGNGYTKDYPVERLFRDAKICEIYEGTSEIQRLVISKYLYQ